MKNYKNEYEKVHINPNICADCKYAWILKRGLDSVKLMCARYDYQEPIDLNVMFVSTNDKDYWFLRKFIGKEIRSVGYYNEHLTEFRVGYVDNRLIDFCKENVFCNKNTCPYYMEHLMNELNKK